MRVRPSFILLALGVLLCASCAREKSTDQMISDLKSHEEKDRLNAVRTLPQRSGDAARTVPALIAALKDHEADIRRSAALGLGSFGEQAREAIPGLQEVLRDRDGRVREAAGVALSRIDPSKFPDPHGAGAGKKK